MKKIFLLWDRHTTGFCRVLMALLIPAAIWETFGLLLVNSMILLWLIVKTGYEKKWDKHTEVSNGE